jgi:hypothetical protein
MYQKDTDYLRSANFCLGLFIVSVFSLLFRGWVHFLPFLQFPFWSVGFLVLGDLLGIWLVLVPCFPFFEFLGFCQWLAIFTFVLVLWEPVPFDVNDRFLLGDLALFRFRLSWFALILTRLKGLIE